MTDKSEPAFPFNMCNNTNRDQIGAIGDLIKANTTAFYPGLTKREYFAAMAMQGLLSNGDHVSMYKHDIGTEIINKHLSIGAVKLADALIEELNK